VAFAIGKQWQVCIYQNLLDLTSPLIMETAGQLYLYDRCPHRLSGVEGQAREQEERGRLRAGRRRDLRRRHLAHLYVQQLPL
jgi:hypothetical protein